MARLGKSRRMRRMLIVILATLLAVPLVGALPSEPIPHLILEIIRDSRDNVIGYKVHHEVEMVTYVAMLGPGSMDRDSCRRDGIKLLEVMEGDGLPTFTGSDGRQCPLARFKPDVADPNENLPPQDTPQGECSSCPGG